MWPPQDGAEDGACAVQAALTAAQPQRVQQQQQGLSVRGAFGGMRVAPAIALKDFGAVQK